MSLAGESLLIPTGYDVWYTTDSVSLYIHNDSETVAADDDDGACPHVTFFISSAESRSTLISVTPMLLLCGRLRCCFNFDIIIYGFIFEHGSYIIYQTNIRN